jgi:hypothetical protein
VSRLALFLLPLVAAHGAYQPEQWQYRRAIRIGEPGVLHTVRVTAAIQRNARPDLADLRLVREQEEVPFVLETIESPGRPILETIAEMTPPETASEDARTKVYELDAGENTPPYDRLRLDVEDEAFHRNAEVEASADGRVWRQVTRGAVWRKSGDDRLSLMLGSRRDRFLRLRIHNRDDAPIAVKQVFFEAPARVVRFVPKDEGDYALVYGNPRAERPSYDLIVLLSPDQAATRVHVLAGPETGNAAYAGPDAGKPWTERYRNFFNGFLIAAVAVMMFLIVRVMRQVLRR